MGPPPFGDGNGTWRKNVKSGFPQLQWGHRLSAMETGRGGRTSRAVSRSFNGATAFRRWKRTGWRNAQHTTTGFNGATAFRRWKQLGVSVPFQFCHTASMGPPPFGDGNLETTGRNLVQDIGLQWGHRLSAMETLVPPLVMVMAWSSFNGATAFRRWKRQRRRPGPPWCARFNGATAFRRWKLVAPMLTPVGPEAASMGPPPFGDGNDQAFYGGFVELGTLQWGHRLSAMETVLS